MKRSSKEWGFCLFVSFFIYNHIRIGSAYFIALQSFHDSLFSLFVHIDFYLVVVGAGFAPVVGAGFAPVVGAGFAQVVGPC